MNLYLLLHSSNEIEGLSVNSWKLHLPFATRGVFDESELAVQSTWVSLKIPSKESLFEKIGSGHSLILTTGI